MPWQQRKTEIYEAISFIKMKMLQTNSTCHFNWISRKNYFSSKTKKSRQFAWKYTIWNIQIYHHRKWIKCSFGDKLHSNQINWNIICITNAFCVDHFIVYGNKKENNKRFILKYGHPIVVGINNSKNLHKAQYCFAIYLKLSWLTMCALFFLFFFVVLLYLFYVNLYMFGQNKVACNRNRIIHSVCCLMRAS